jgi:hypothetical protein
MSNDNIYKRCYYHKECMAIQLTHENKSQFVSLVRIIANEHIKECEDGFYVYYTLRDKDSHEKIEVGSWFVYELPQDGTGEFISNEEFLLKYKVD